MTRPCLFGIAAVLLALTATPPAWAQKDEDNKTDPTEGHSFHGEVFNEGPRQAAVLIPGTGDVRFPITTKSPEAQRFFNQGVGQLHGFWYFESERSFRQVAAIDPDCAMAYWGMAMSNFDNQKRGKGFILEAKERRDKAGERERLYIDALAKFFEDTKDEKARLRDLVRAYEGIIEKHPDDLEAKAFLGWQLFTNNSKGLNYQSHYANNLQLGEILTEDADHPVHHYRIHLWDGEKPERALASAAACGPAAPGIAHMWHMPGHTYSKLQRYRDAVWQQEASARVDHAHMIRYRIIPDQIHNFAHNNEWLIRNLNHLGQVSAALDLARNMVELPRLPKFGGKENKEFQAGGSWKYGRERLRDTLLRFEMWDELIRYAEHTQYLRSDRTVIPDVEWHRLLAIAKCEKGDLAGARPHLDKIEALLAEETGRRDKAVADAEKKAKEAKKAAKDIDEAKKAAEKNFANKVEDLEHTANEVRVYAALAAQPADQPKAREILPKLKQLAKARHATLWQRAGDMKKAVEVAAQAVREGKNEVHPLAVQVALLHADGQKDEARKAFDLLRTVAGGADREVAMLKRLDPIAREFGYPEDWRTPAPAAKDLGPRPKLDDLGPFRWSPPTAPTWTLQDSTGKSHSLTDYEGKPVLVIFYLGKGCVHCMEQLNNFAPVTEKYKKAGIPIVAISTDTTDGLAGTFQKAAAEGAKADNPFPFPLLSDANLDVFKSYRAHDDFEKQPLHGTFLIDGQGRIRWQDIGYEPFMHTEWLLEECGRLLSFTDA
ncbi:MAG: redoxin domain-containing protein [Verrucomicrobiales bacterium]|nr:redoxin domain-containing protein [Verrucomicrobiales bacterium]